MSSRSSKVEPLPIENILRNSASIAARPSPIEHIGSPSSPTASASSSRPQSSRGHDAATNTTNFATDTSSVPQRTNRFSVSFPVVPSNSASPVRTARSPVREAPSVVPESLALLAGPSDGNFLTAIAAQERRVLELKEELARAEAHLDTLKKQWTHNEAHKKSNDAKSLTKLQPVRTSVPTTEAEEDSDGSNAWMQQEMERRKALLSTNKSSNRTVFSGSRHARTLSLLAPAKKESGTNAAMPPPSTRPPRKESLSRSSQRGEESANLQPKRSQILRAVTLPDLTVDGTESLPPANEAAEAGSDKDALLKTGKKVATDLRDGLWTFWEDLRQVTVGEEATKVEPPPRRRSSVQNLRTVTKQRSKSSLQTSSRGTTTASKSSADPRWWPPARPKQNDTSTTPLATAPTLTDPLFFTEFGSPVVQRETPVKTKKSTTPAGHQEKSVLQSSPGGSSDIEAWDTWDENSPQWSRASSALSEAITNPSTVSNAASPRTSAEMQKPTNKTSQRSNGASESIQKDPIPWPALNNLGPKSLRHSASQLMAAWEQSRTPSPIKEDQND